MKALVCARHFGYLRNFESVLIELAQRGHHLHLAADREESSGGLEMVQRLASRFPQVTFGWTPRRSKDDQWLSLATDIRLSLDFLRYLEPAYNKTPMLRRRAKERTPSATVWLVERAGFRYRPGRRMLETALNALEAGVPLHEPYIEFLRQQTPDVVILTPVIDLGSPQLDMLKGAVALGLRTVLAVGSWDHLSSKALLRIMPQALTVWNDTQRDEALSMHRVPSDRIVVTGAQCYDQWFDRRPSRTREEFCRDMGLSPDRPFVLYVCSSLFRGDPPEAEFTVAWLKAIRASDDPRLAGLGMLVRPHPGRLDEWKGHDIASLAVAFHGANPIDTAARHDYFDALFYSAAVVGLNTSAFLEAGIVGRPVLAVLPKAYWKSQEGTLHFRYLTEIGGGLLRTSRSLDEHLPQLAAAISGEQPADNDAFVRAFIRPHGLEAAATPRFADAVERVAAAPPPAPRGTPLVGHLTQPLLRVRLGAREARARVRRANKDAKHDVRKARERALRQVRRPLKVLTERVLTSRKRIDVTKSAEQESATHEVREALTAMRSSGRPILIGPWLSETGFELLYWIPFLRWAQKYGHLRASRIVAVSRGGAAPWYDEIAERYVDIFDVASLDEFRAANEERVYEHGGQKHFEASEFDEQLAHRVARRLGITRYDWLHPGLMYNLFLPFWMQLAPVSLVKAFSLPRLLQLKSSSRLAGLPRRYIAVKFYTNQSLPQAPANQQFVSALLKRLTARTDVVLLQTGLALDDHGEYGVDGDRIHTVDHLMTPSNNLDIQTRVIAGADALITTYGGFSYLGPLLGVETLTFYSNAAGFRIDHLEVAHRTFREIGAAPFVALNTADVGILESLLGSPRLAVAR